MIPAADRLHPMAIESDQLRKRKLFGQAALGAQQDPDQFIIFP
jgi:hypothetical protein